MISLFKKGVLLALSFVVVTPIFAAHPLNVAKVGGNSEVLKALPAINTTLEKSNIEIATTNKNWRDQAAKNGQQTAILIEGIYHLGIVVAIRQTQAYNFAQAATSKRSEVENRELDRKQGFHLGQSVCAQETAKELTDGILSITENPSTNLEAIIDDAYHAGLSVGYILARKHL